MSRALNSLQLPRGFTCITFFTVIKSDALPVYSPICHLSPINLHCKDLRFPLLSHIPDQRQLKRKGYLKVLSSSETRNYIIHHREELKVEVVVEEALEIIHFSVKTRSIAADHQDFPHPTLQQIPQTLYGSVPDLLRVRNLDPECDLPCQKCRPAAHMIRA